MYPGNGSRIGDIMDGTAHTIMCVETCDNTQSVWTLGTDATLVGMPYQGDPQSTSPTGMITGFTNTPTTNGGSNSAGSFYMPQGATGTFDDTGAITGLQSGSQVLAVPHLSFLRFSAGRRRRLGQVSTL